MLPPNTAYDLIASAPSLRFSTAQAAVLSLHARDGRADHWHPQGQFLEGSRTVHLRPQGRRHEEGRHDHLCRWMDAAHQRHANDPHRRDAAIAARQHGARGRWNERSSGSFQYSGRTDMGWNVRHLPWLSEDAESATDTDFESYIEETYAQNIQAGSEWDSFNYWSNTPKFMPCRFSRRCTAMRRRKKTTSASSICPR